MLKFFSLIFQHHSNLFFSNNSNKRYFIFLRDILIKISKSDLIGPRLLATNFGNYIELNNYFLLQFIFI